MEVPDVSVSASFGAEGIDAAQVRRLSKTPG